MDVTITKNVVSYSHDNTTSTMESNSEAQTRTNVITNILVEYTFTNGDTSVVNKFCHHLSLDNIYLQTDYVEQASVTTDDLVAMVDANEPRNVQYINFERNMKEWLYMLSLTDAELVTL